MLIAVVPNVPRAVIVAEPDCRSSAVECGATTCRSSCGVRESERGAAPARARRCLGRAARSPWRRRLRWSRRRSDRAGRRSSQSTSAVSMRIEPARNSTTSRGGVGVGKRCMVCSSSADPARQVPTGPASIRLWCGDGGADGVDQPGVGGTPGPCRGVIDSLLQRFWQAQGDPGGRRLVLVDRLVAGRVTGVAARGGGLPRDAGRRRTEAPGPSGATRPPAR